MRQDALNKKEAEIRVPRLSSLRFAGAWFSTEELSALHRQGQRGRDGVREAGYRLPGVGAWEPTGVTQQQCPWRPPRLQCHSLLGPGTQALGVGAEKTLFLPATSHFFPQRQTGEEDALRPWRGDGHQISSWSRTPQNQEDWERG